MPKHDAVWMVIARMVMRVQLSIDRAEDPSALRACTGMLQAHDQRGEHYV